MQKGKTQLNREDGTKRKIPVENTLEKKTQIENFMCKGNILSRKKKEI